MLKKFKALLQWFMSLEVQKHRHWCYVRNPTECEHSNACWYCTGILCVNDERKDCPKCKKKSSKQTISAYSSIVKVDQEIRN